MFERASQSRPIAITLGFVLVATALGGSGRPPAATAIVADQEVALVAEPEVQATHAVDGFPAWRGTVQQSFGADPNGGVACNLPVSNHCWPQTWNSGGFMSTTGAWAVGGTYNIQTAQSERYPAVAGASYRLSIRMKPGGSQRWVGFCFYTSDVPLNNNDNRLSCEQKKAPSFDGYPWRSYLLTATAPAGTTHVGLHFISSQYYDDIIFSTTAPPSVPVEHLMGTCSAGHAACTAHFESDPVNTASGNYVTSVTDLSLPGRGLGFALSRTYNSIDPSTGDLGIGWRHSFSARLVVNPDATVRVEAEDGASYLFTPDGAGGFDTPPGGRSTLESVTGGYELTRPDQLRYRFNTSGALTALVDRNDNEIALTYAAGELSTVTDTVGRTMTFSHDTSGRISQIVGPLGRQVTYAYDASGRLSSVTDIRGGLSTYGYDSSNRLTTAVDPNGNTVVTNEYGTDGRISAQTDALGNRGTFAWNATTAVSTYTDARGGTWLDDYHENRLVSRTDPIGNVTTYGYDADLNLASVTDARGNTTTMTYDAAGHVLTRTAPAPLAYVETFTYNAFGDVLTATDGRGNTTTNQYDAAGNLVQVTQPGSAVTVYARDAAGTGLLLSTTDPRGKTTSFAYDTQANLTSVTDPLGNVASMTYDALGRLISSVDPRGNLPGSDPDDFRTTLTYDGDLVASTTDPLGSTVTTTYDPVGNRLSVTDPLGNVTSYMYDDANHLLTVTDPDLNVTAYAYDEVGNLVTRTDANLHVTTYAYDLGGRLTSTADPLGNDWLLTYDANGNLLTRTDARDQVTTYAYDKLNRRTAIDYGPAGTPDVGYAYDANGNLTQMTDGAGTEDYVYDNRNRLTSVTRGSDTFSYAYDAGGNVTNRTYPGGQVITYAYDDAGRMASAAVGSAVTTYAYDAAGRPLTAATPDGLTASHSYDQAGRLLEVAHVTATATLSRFTYGLDAAGRRTNLTTALGATGFAYDDRGQLIEACFGACPAQTPVPELPCLACVGSPLPRPAPQASPDPADTFVRYTYDPVGNRLTEQDYLGTTAHVYDAADRLTSVDGPNTPAETYTYDANGNQTAAGADTFAWNAADLLTSASVDGTTHTYAYAGDGRRISTTTGGATTGFAWDLAFGLPMLVAERDGSGATLRSYAYGLDLLSQSSAGSASYYHSDGLGSVVDVTDDTGSATRWAEYASFGQPRYQAAATGVPANPFGFTGEYLDPTGLYHLRARQYDPGIGRFLSQDPVVPSLDDPYFATYVYVSNAPGWYVDPSGRVRETPYPSPRPTPSPPPGWGPQPADDFEWPQWVEDLVPCDPQKFGIGLAQDALGALAIAGALVTEGGSFGAATPIAIAEAAFGLYHIYEGQVKIHEAYHCE